MVIRNAKVLQGEAFESLDVLLDGEYIGKVAEGIPGGTDSLDGEGCYLIPGFVDIHSHGFFGVDFDVGFQTFEKAMKRYAECGVTSVAATVRCMPTLEAMIDTEKNIIKEREKKHLGASIDAIHLEGPFISKNKSGAMRTPDFECSKENFLALIEAGEGLVKLMTIAPERENAEEVIKTGAEMGVRMSLGHTLATYDEAMKGIMAGASGATHTFNAMRAYDHREPGVLGAVLTSPEVSCEAICDFVHLAPATVKLIYTQKGADKMIAVSDSGAMSGLGDGVYTVGGAVRIVKDGVCRNEEGRLAGSTMSMLEGAKNLLSMGVSLEEITKITAKNPAKAIGLDSIIGTIEEGKRADLILCDAKLNIKAVFARGVRIGSDIRI